MSDQPQPQPYLEPERRPDPEATYSPKPYLPPPPPVAQPYQPYGPPPYQQDQRFAGPPQPYYAQYPARPPYKTNSVWAHIGLFLFTGGIGNVIYALWVYDQNKRNGY